jgi:hypothetical protein
MGLTYQHANDRDQEDDLNQAVEDEEDTANHLERVWRLDLWNATIVLLLSSDCVWVFV